MPGRSFVLNLLLVFVLCAPVRVEAQGCGPSFGKLVSRLLLVAGGGIAGGLSAGLVYIEAGKEGDRESCGYNANPGSPTVVVYGDSLSSGFPGYGATTNMLVEAKTLHSGWPIGGPESLCGRLRRSDPSNDVTVWNLASPGAQIDPTSHGPNWLQSNVVGTRDLSLQVSQALAEKQLAPVHVIFVGHNNMDWISDARAAGADPEAHRAVLAERIAAGMETQVRRLIERAQRDGTSLDVVLYGLANFEDSYWGTSMGLEANRKDPTKYPYAHLVREKGPSYAPEYASRTAELEKRTNELLRRTVEKLQGETGGKIRIEFSDVLATQNFRDMKYFSERDAFHFSKQGRALTSQIVFDDLARRGLTSRDGRAR
jgi:lysophospholipase L1-like esterase